MRCHQRLFKVRDYDLAATLDSGQAFRWRGEGAAWTAVVGHRWVRLTQTNEGIEASTVSEPAEWQWLEDYLQIHVDLDCILKQLPEDPLLAQAVQAHRGLRLVQQDPWECLASFILSSTKQITHIKQIVESLCTQHGDRVETPARELAAHAFPTPDRIAALTEADLRSLKMGFRAPYLREAAKRVASGQLALDQLRQRPLQDARVALMELPGVGRKIADCVLLFALGFNEAFPVDVWVTRALQSTWFPDRAMTLPQLVAFSEEHFGQYGGYAQQYLFHHARTEARIS